MEIEIGRLLLLDCFCVAVGGVILCKYKEIERLVVIADKNVEKLINIFERWKDSL